jgi:hypothetical protein
MFAILVPAAAGVGEHIPANSSASASSRGVSNWKSAAHKEGLR